MKMGDLFSLTLRVIVYIPNPHAGAEAVQVKRERERWTERHREWGVFSKKLPHDKSLSSCKSHIKIIMNCAFVPLQ